MGHFSHTCKLSHLPIIGGTKVVLFLLKMRDHWYEYSEKSLRQYGTTYMCSNDGTTARFIPFAFPIRGEYDDYGGITNIEQDENTAFLEEYFGMDIDTICGIITCGRKDDGYADVLKPILVKEGDYPDKAVYKEGYDELLALSGMWVHQGFHDNLVKNYKQDGYDRIGMGTPPLLKSFGFEYVGKDESKERFDQVFKKGDCTLYSDGEWLDGSIYRLEDLKNYCSEHGEDIDISKAVASSKAQQVYDYILPEAREKVIELEGEEIKNDFQKWFDLRNDMGIIKACKIFDMNGSWDMATDLGKKFIHAAEDGKFRKHVHELFIFTQAMYACGKYYDVTGTSPQDGELLEVHWVLKTAYDIAEVKVERYNEEYYGNMG
jgi:hypothetical protein